MDALQVRRGERPDGSVVLELIGELDAHTVDEFRRAVTAIGTDQVVLDVGGLAFLDTWGLEALTELEERVRGPGGRVVLVGASHDVVRVLKLAEVTERFELHPPEAS